MPARLITTPQGMLHLSGRLHGQPEVVEPEGGGLRHQHGEVGASEGLDGRAGDPRRRINDHGVEGGGRGQVFDGP